MAWNFAEDSMLGHLPWCAGAAALGDLAVMKPNAVNWPCDMTSGPSMTMVSRSRVPMFFTAMESTSMQASSEVL